MVILILAVLFVDWRVVSACFRVLGYGVGLCGCLASVWLWIGWCAMCATWWCADSGDGAHSVRMIRKPVASEAVPECA